MSIRKIIDIAFQNKDEVIIICEDDHEFTQNHNNDLLIRYIIEAYKQGCDILNGGVGKYFNPIPISSNCFWVSNFWRTQFIVIYRKFFESILAELFDQTVTADDKVSKMTSNEMLLFPFISTQREFGYSDVTQSNNIKGHVSYLFKASSEKLMKYKIIYVENIGINKCIRAQ